MNALRFSLLEFRILPFSSSSSSSLLQVEATMIVGGLPVGAIQQESNKINAIGLGVGLGVAVLVLGGAVYWYLERQEKKKMEQEWRQQMAADQARGREENQTSGTGQQPR